MEVSIREAKKIEIEAIINLQTLSLLNNSHLGSRAYNNRQIEAIARDQADARREFLDSETIFLAEFDRKLIGFIAFSISSLEIHGLFVHPDFMRKGIGTKLLNEAELTSEKKIRKITIMSSLESSNFYRKNGFVYQMDTGFYAQNSIWIPCQLLEKVLIPTSTTPTSTTLGLVMRSLFP